RDLNTVLGARPPGADRSPIGDVHRVLEAVVADLTDLAAGIEEELDDVEAEVFDTRVREDYARIYSLRKRIARIDREASALVSALHDAHPDIHAATESQTGLRIRFRHL